MNCPHCAAIASKEQTKKTSLGYRTFRCSNCKRTGNERTGTPFNFVECPTCGARRTLKSLKDRPHFPSHPRRLTSPPKGERRWVEREEIWRVVED